jgi:hypothetical protein
LIAGHHGHADMGSGPFGFRCLRARPAKVDTGFASGRALKLKRTRFLGVK